MLTSDNNFWTEIPQLIAVSKKVASVADSLQINYLFDFKSATGFNINKGLN